MHVNPQSVLRFAADHYPLLREIYDQPEGFSPADLTSVIESHADENPPSPSYVVERIQELHLIEERPGETATYEMTPFVREFFEFLLRQHHLATPEVLKGYLNELEGQTSELDESVRVDDPARTQRAVQKLNAAIESIRKFSFGNYAGIVDQLLKLKSDREQYSVKERFEIIVDLWEHYLKPLEELVSVRKSTEVAFNRLDRHLQQAADIYQLDGRMHRELLSTRHRLTRMRRELACHYQSSYTELLPLYDTYRRQNRLYRGASRLLERLSRNGLNSLGLTEFFALPVHRNKGLLADSEIESYLHIVHDYTPTAPRPIAIPDGAPARGFLSVEEALDELSRSLPVKDVMSWCVERYNDRPPRELLKVFQAVIREPSFVRYFTRRGTYRCNGFLLEAPTVTVHARP